MPRDSRKDTKRGGKKVRRTPEQSDSRSFNDRPNDRGGDRTNGRYNDRNNEQSDGFEKDEINELILYGRNTVMEAIKSGRSIDKIFMREADHQEGTAAKILTMAKDSRIQVKFIGSEKLDSLTNNSKHQGVLAFMAAQDYVELGELFARAEAKGESPFFIILDQIEDPHNLGAIIRTANVVGAHGVIIPRNRAVSLTSTVAKTSAGAIEYTPVCRVTNLSRTIEEIKAKGVWVTGADMKGTSMYDIDMKGAIALVIGSEGKGISRLVKEKCDFLVNIPMIGKVSSLNASVAASIIMYEIFKQRQG